MNNTTQKPKTIDEVYGHEPGTFDKFLKEKETALKRMDQEAKERIHKATLDSMVWAA